MVQKLGNDAISSQKLYPGIGSDKWRRQVGDDNKYVKETASPDFQPTHEVCQRKSQRRRQSRRNHRNLQGINHGAPVKFLCKEMGKVLKRKGTGIPGNDTLVQDEEERIEDEESKECKNHDTEQVPQGQFFLHDGSPSIKDVPDVL